MSDGEDVVIARDATDTWSLTVDPAGSNDNALPASTPTIGGPVRLELCGTTQNAGTNWATATPGPGFSNLVVSGAGGVGIWHGGKSHTFMWDHITDLGSGFNDSVQLHSRLG